MTKKLQAKTHVHDAGVAELACCCCCTAAASSAAPLALDLAPAATMLMLKLAGGVHSAEPPSRGCCIALLGHVDCS